MKLKTITISNINVTNGKAAIAFSSKSSAGQWLEVDKVVFIQQ